MSGFFKDLFNADVKEYRSIPFWSWNDELEPDELKEQIRWMKEQGFGGYFMHARGGLNTEYLGDKWFECVEACLDEGEKQGMDSWAYDENGWPSGFVGGKLLEDENNRDRYLTYDIGDFNSKATYSYSLKGEKLVRVYDERGDGEFLNVYEHISTSTADILNYEVVEKFLNLTHEKYKEKLGKKFNKLLKGFFTDEPQYYRAEHAYTRVLPDYFKKLYGEDITENLGLLFVKKQGYRKFRYRYWKCMQQLMLKNFAEHIYNWCNKNEVELTGHYVEEANLTWQMKCNAGIMPFYEFEHIPGIDKLSRTVDSPVIPKQVSSVARQLGKKLVISEMFGCCGWDVTPTELKRIAEWQYVNGVNLMCQHLLPYSEWGQRKRDYPAHFSWVNPWVKHDFKSFNDYFARLGYILGESEEIVNVAMFQPIRSSYLDYQEYDYSVAYYLDKSYDDLAKKLTAMHVPYHIIDETVCLRHGKVDNGKLIVGKCRYDFIVFPKTTNMDKETETLLNEFYKQGGKILFTDGLPQYLEGEEHVYLLESNTSFDEIVANQPYTVNDYSTEVQSTLRIYKGRPYIYAVNVDAEKTYTLEFSGNFKGFTAFNIETGEIEKKSNEVDFVPSQSYVLFLNDQEKEYEKTSESFTLSSNYSVVETTDNYFTLDKLRYSFDGVNYSNRVSYVGVFNEMLEKKYEGVLYLKYEFEVKDVPERIKFISEDMNVISITVNGEKVEFDGVSDFDKKTYTSNISGKVKIGNNEVVIKIKFYEDESVYYALYGENVTESLRNCLVYNTTIEACYLQGDFGVYSKAGFKKGKEKNVLIAEDDFYISKKNIIINESVADGYPFFAGRMTLAQNFTYEGGATLLKLNGRYHLAEVKLNGKNVSKGYFDKVVDLKEHLKKGENTIEITLYSSNRNLMGPHHLKETEEPLSVGPYTFENMGTWKDCVSSNERNNYAFVRFGLFND